MEQILKVTPPLVLDSYNMQQKLTGYCKDRNIDLVSITTTLSEQ